MAHLAALVQVKPIGPWSAAGHARIVSKQGRFEGSLKAILEPPEKLRAELLSRALFGMVGEHVVVAMPGDGYVLFFRQHEDTLERQSLGDSELGQLLPTGAPGELQALLTGRPPWPRGQVPADLLRSARVQRSEDGGRSLVVRVAVEGTNCVLFLQTREGRLQGVSWTRPGRGRVEVRYGSWRSWDGMELPGRMKLEIPDEGLEAEIDLEQAEAHEGFSARDFEVY